MICYKFIQGDWIKKVFLDGVIPRGKCRIARGSKLWGSTLGENCAVESKAKVTNSIALDNVLILSGATVEGCILSSHAVIGPNSVIKECLVGPKYQIPAEGGANNLTNDLKKKYMVLNLSYFFLY